MSNLLVNLIEQQNVLVEDIFQHKSDINNIDLQLDRDDPEDESRKDWRSRTKYAKAMKEAELERLENQLEGVKSAIKVSENVRVDKTPEGAMLAQEFLSAAQRRLTPEVFESIKQEAQEMVQDMLYDAAHCSHNGN